MTLEKGLVRVAGNFGMQLRVVWGDGTQPIGRGIGPALEARDVLSVLRCDPEAPNDLRERSLELAGALLELAGKLPDRQGKTEATRALDDGRAWSKFQRICAAQGGMREPATARFGQALVAPHGGTVTAIDNRRISRLAKLAGAPEDKTAGVDLHVRIGDKVAPGAALCTVQSQAEGGLAYAMTYAAANADLFRITPP